MMRSGERVKEFLRPFVASRAWDFCVIWKLGDDPSRYTHTLSILGFLFSGDVSLFVVPCESLSNIVSVAY